jgi:tight adherence protein B
MKFKMEWKRLLKIVIMDFSSHFFIYLSKICLTMSVALIAIVYKTKVKNKLESLQKNESEDVPEILSKSEIRAKALLICSGIFLLLFFFGIPFLISLVLASLGMSFLPKLLQLNAQDKVYQAFDDSLADSLQGLASSIEAGLTLQQALGVAVESAPTAFSFQARRAILEYKLGTDIDQCLLNISNRIPTGSAKMSFGALIIGRRLGGPLPTILKRISTIIRERARVEGRLRALTAQGRGQGMLVCALPVCVILGTAILSPAKFEMLTTNLMGQVLLFTVIGLEAIGIFVTLKTLKLEI